MSKASGHVDVLPRRECDGLLLVAELLHERARPLRTTLLHRREQASPGILAHLVPKLVTPRQRERLSQRPGRAHLDRLQSMIVSHPHARVIPLPTIRSTL